MKTTLRLIKQRPSGATQIRRRALIAAWEALYTLEHQPDDSLKITGCSLLKAGHSA
jgi:hypothetical protein